MNDVTSRTPTRASARGEDARELRVVVRSVVSAILCASPNHPDVDDATNETLRRALEGDHRVHSNDTHAVPTQSDVRGWIVGIARNVARDILRQRARAYKRAAPSTGTDDALDVTEQLVDTKPSPLDRTLKTEQISHLTRALASLPDSQRIAIELFHIEGKSYAEISSKLKVPVGTVATWILRARKTLADAMREEVT